MFSKARTYFCDGDAVAEAAIGGAPGNKKHKGKTAYLGGDKKLRTKAGLCDMAASESRNPRSVWTIASESLKEKHFAAFPTELVRRCMMAATAAAGCCQKCRTPYAPVVERERVPTRPGTDTKTQAAPRGWATGDAPHDAAEHNTPEGRALEIGNRDPQRHVAVNRVTGYRPSCGCKNAGEPVPCIVLDLYAGSGTTLQTAVWYGRDAIGCELSQAYAAIAERRIAKRPRCLIRAAKRAGKVLDEVVPDDGLFAEI